VLDEVERREGAPTEPVELLEGGQVVEFGHGSSLFAILT
jgi:hypothetical protein